MLAYVFLHLYSVGFYTLGLWTILNYFFNVVLGMSPFFVLFCYVYGGFCVFLYTDVELFQHHMLKKVPFLY